MQLYHKHRKTSQSNLDFKFFLLIFQPFKDKEKGSEPKYFVTWSYALFSYVILSPCIACLLYLTQSNCLFMPILLLESELLGLCPFSCISPTEFITLGWPGHVHSWPALWEYATACKTAQQELIKLKPLITFYPQFAGQRACLLKGEPVSL